MSSAEEKIMLLAELSQEKHQHMLDLDRLAVAEQNLTLANENAENLNQQLALYSQLNMTLQQSLDDVNQMLQMTEQQLAQERLKGSASDRSQHEIQELRQTLEDAQSNYEQELRKVSEEKRRIEEEYKMLEAQKLGLEHELQSVKGELEVEKLQATLSQQEAALRETSLDGPSKVDQTVVDGLQQQISRLTRELEEERSLARERTLNLNSRDDELEALRSRVAIAERERAQLAERLQELESRNNATNATTSDGLAKMREELQRVYEEEKRNLVDELNQLRHSEETLKREAEAAQRKLQYLTEDFQKNQEAKDVLEEENNTLQSRFNKLQREKSDLQTQVKRLLQEKEEGGVQLKRALEEKDENARREESRQHQALEEQLSQLKGEKASLEADKSGLIERLRKLEAELEAKTLEERSKHDDSDRSRQLEEKIQELGAKNAQLEHSLKEEQNRYQAAYNELATLRKSHEELQSVHSANLHQRQSKERALEERVAELQLAIDTSKESQHDIDSLRQALDQAHKAAEVEKEYVSKLSKRVAEDEAKLGELVKVNAGLKRQVKELKSSSGRQTQTEIEDLKKRLRDEMYSHSGTLQQLEESQKSLQESNEIIEKLTSDVTRLQDSSAPLKREIDSLKAKNAQLTRVLAEEREAWKQEQQRQEQMKQAHDEQMQTAALENLRKEYEEIQMEMREELNSKTRGLQGEKEAHERTKQQLLELTQSYERERNVISDLRNQLREALEVNEQNKKETEHSSKELQEARNTITNELQEEQRRHSATKAQMKQLSGTITALQAELSNAKSDHEEAVSNLHRLQQSLEESLHLHEEEQRSITAQLVQKTAQVVDLTQQLIELKKQDANLQEEIQQLKADVATLTEGHRQLENEARALADRHEAEKRVDQETVKQLQETITHLKQQDESSLRQLEGELEELKQELARERDAHQSTKELLEKERIDMELTMIDNLHVQINRLRELYDSQTLLERDFQGMHVGQLEDVRRHPSSYPSSSSSLIAHSHPHHPHHHHLQHHSSTTPTVAVQQHPPGYDYRNNPSLAVQHQPQGSQSHHNRDKENNQHLSVLQRELAMERETLQKTQQELDEERRQSRTHRELASELQLHVMELDRAHNETARDLAETQKQITELKRELDRERNSRKVQAQQHTTSSRSHAPPSATSASSVSSTRATSGSPSSPLSPRELHLPLPPLGFSTTPAASYFAPSYPPPSSSSSSSSYSSAYQQQQRKQPSSSASVSTSTPMTSSFSRTHPTIGIPSVRANGH